MKRDFFRRGVRMQHQFGETEKINGPFVETFEPPPFFVRPGVQDLGVRGPHEPREVQRDGEYAYRPHSSPVQCPSGRMANINGPAPDWAQDIAMPIPVGTKRRLGPPKTDK